MTGGKSILNGQMGSDGSQHSDIPKGSRSPSNIAINLGKVLQQGTRLPLWPQRMPSYFRGYSPKYQDYTSSIPSEISGRKKPHHINYLLGTIRRLAHTAHLRRCSWQADSGLRPSDTCYFGNGGSSLLVLFWSCHLRIPPLAPTSP